MGDRVVIFPVLQNLPMAKSRWDQSLNLYREFVEGLFVPRFNFIFRRLVFTSKDVQVRIRSYEILRDIMEQLPPNHLIPDEGKIKITISFSVQINVHPQ